ncbi:hypothetical protein BKI52_21965 [marine bacterium AO1-C]|nr:hypothetical protein BKI52_21965 [marine bacterium AO1-C]
MYQRIISVSNEIEASSIRAILEENGVPYSIKNLHENALTSIEGHHHFIEIIFPEEHSLPVFRSLTKDYPTRITEVETNTRFTPKLWQYLTFVYAAVATVFLIKYYNAATRSEKNYDVSWSLDNTSLKQVHKTKKGIASYYTDQNYDGNYEKSELYVNNRKFAVFTDKDEDGLFETIGYFTTAGKPAGSYFDNDANGIYEKTFFILPKGDKLTLIDKDQDGLYEFIQLGDQVLRK